MMQLTPQEALNLMQSDMKLWERAEKKASGSGGVALTLNLPWGIGEYTVTLEGMNNAERKRAALSSYGAHIRAIIKDRIDDDSVTARAQRAAAKVEQADSEDGSSLGAGARVREGLPQSPVQAPANEKAAEAYQQDVSQIVGSREALLAERAALRDAVDRNERILKRIRRDIRVIEAALAAWEDDEDAPEDSREAREGTERESQEASSDS